jgi:hypothetical protein
VFGDRRAPWNMGVVAAEFSELVAVTVRSDFVVLLCQIYLIDFDR